MAGWKVRQLDPRQKPEEGEWSIDNGTDTLVAGIGQAGKEKAEKIVGLLNKVGAERLKGPVQQEVTKHLENIHEKAQQLEFQTTNLSPSPDLPFSAIRSLAASLQNSSHELLKVIYS